MILLIKKLPEGIELDEERVENLATVFPLQYLSMFEVMRKRKLKRGFYPSKFRSTVNQVDLCFRIQGRYTFC